MPSRPHSPAIHEESLTTQASASHLPTPAKSTTPMPVLRPRLPSFKQLAPYLHSIDDRRFYSNGGPLSLKLQAELGRHLGCAENVLVTASSGTSGITAALLALDVPEGSTCLMPSWTFAATPHAALAAGFRPQFIDVDQRTWALNPAIVKQLIKGHRQAIGAVVVVSPFGAPLDLTAWQNLQQETGIRVIVDAAAGFDTVRSSDLISVVSLHATKILAAGEGGFIVAPSAEMAARIRACSNFGFDGTRSATRKAINSKLSEYHSAVALASLDNWPSVRMRHLQIASWYRRALAGAPHVSLQPGYGDGWACGTTNVLLESDSAESISRYMLREGIETRMWWGRGCHVQPAFMECPRAELATTDYLGVRVLGLPHFPDMQKANVLYVVSILLKALRSRAHGRRAG